MPIIDQKVITDHRQKDGRRRVRFLYRDHLGINHNSSPRMIGANDDAAAIMAASIPGIESDLADREYLEIRHDIYKALSDPLHDDQGRAVHPEHQSRDTVITRLLNDALSNPDPLEIMNSTAVLDLFTDNKIKNLLGVTQGKVDAIREKTARVRQLVSIIQDYTPPIEEV